MSERRLALPALLTLVMVWLSQAALAAGDCQHLTATGNPEYPHISGVTQKIPRQLIGANADLLKHLAKALGLVVDVVYVGPWSRAQEEVNTGRVDLLAGYFRTNARELVTDFISPPFLYTSSVAWVRKGEGFTYNDWSDLKGRRGGTLVNNSHGQAFDDYARAQLNLEAVPSASQAFQKLLLRRSDYVVFEQYPGLALARTLDKDEALDILDPPISSEGLYLALSRKSGCNVPALREKLARKMSELVAGPLPGQLVEQNLERWRRQQVESVR